MKLKQLLRTTAVNEHCSIANTSASAVMIRGYCGRVGVEIAGATGAAREGRAPHKGTSWGPQSEITQVITIDHTPLPSQP